MSKDQDTKETLELALAAANLHLGNQPPTPAEYRELKRLLILLKKLINETPDENLTLFYRDAMALFRQIPSPNPAISAAFYGAAVSAMQDAYSELWRFRYEEGLLSQPPRFSKFDP